ncbi:MAG: hypothetical protein NBV63_00815 [Candidatus Pacebacteria bacterium]|nr:hypothetical protein [Candidatus Paceibacterota bacterium]
MGNEQPPSDEIPHDSEIGQRLVSVSARCAYLAAALSVFIDNAVLGNQIPPDVERTLFAFAGSSAALDFAFVSAKVPWLKAIGEAALNALKPANDKPL